MKKFLSILGVLVFLGFILPSIIGLFIPDIEDEDFDVALKCATEAKLTEDGIRSIILDSTFSGKPSKGVEWEKLMLKPRYVKHLDTADILDENKTILLLSTEKRKIKTIASCPNSWGSSDRTVSLSSLATSPDESTYWWRIKPEKGFYRSCFGEEYFRLTRENLTLTRGFKVNYGGKDKKSTYYTYYSWCKKVEVNEALSITNDWQKAEELEAKKKEEAAKKETEEFNEQVEEQKKKNKI